jgi:tetratricopeptide (TPR) repeat protein
LWNRAKIRVRSGLWSEAIADCDRAIALEPDDQNSHFWRGLALLNLNRHEESLADFRISLAQRTDDDWCLRHLAWILVGGPLELRNAQEARRLAEKAEKLARERKHAHHPLCLAALGMARYRLGEFEVARATLEEAIELGAANPRTFLFVALCHHQIGNSESAQRYFEEAIDRIERHTQNDGLGDTKYIRAEAEEFLEIVSMSR